MIEVTGPGKAERPSKQGSKRTRRDEVAEGRLMRGEKRKKAEGNDDGDKWKRWKRRGAS
jgi:hypothetical protein